MKIDQDYLKDLLNAFQAEESLYTDINKLKEKGFDHLTGKFLFHIQILEDKKLIENCTKDFRIGYDFTLDGGISWTILPLRLTANGHELLEALNKSEVWDIIKKEFKEASVSTLFSVGTTLVKNLALKKIEKYL
jgi:hypothetical protein